jgi:nicotinamide-nucleotide amidase
MTTLIQQIYAEVITVGDEILIGQITDTNTQWISKELSDIGIKTIRKSSVGDTENAILDVLNEASHRADIILITGGLGPTKDDITKTTLCKYFDTTLDIHPEALEMITAYFAKRGRELKGINHTQAALPLGCTYLPNRWGTAPGMWFEKNGKIYVSMPGVPSEMKGLMNEEVLPRLKTHFETPAIFHKNIRTVGIGESILAEMISDWEDALPPEISLAYLPSLGGVKLRLSGTGNDMTGIKTLVEAQIAKVLPIIAEFVFGYDDDELEVVIGKKLKQQGLTLATAESCTGGAVAAAITKVAGSSAYFIGSMISYSNEVKMNQLGVSLDTLLNFGAVSEPTIKEMAEGCRKILNTDIALATSGIAGPDGGTPDKPVGTIWIALASRNETIAQKLQLGGNREQNIFQTTIAVLNLLRKYLNQ